MRREPTLSLGDMDTRRVIPRLRVLRAFKTSTLRARRISVPSVLSFFWPRRTRSPAPDGAGRRRSWLEKKSSRTDKESRNMRWSAGRLASMMGLLFLALASLAAAQKPGISEKPVAAKPIAKPVSPLVKARWRVLGARPLTMYYYSPDSRGIKSLQEHASQMALVAPQSFWVDAGGFVHGEVPSQILEIAKRAKLPVMPLVVNPGFDRREASALLRSVKAQQRAVTYLAYLAKRDNFVGWQLDLEYIDPQDKSYYTRFVQRVAARLHRDGRLLSIAVVPRFSDAYPDADPSQEFHSGEWGAPYDFRAL